MEPVPAEPRSLRDMLEHARKAKAAKERADAEWRAAQEELRRVERSGSLSGELEREVAELLGDEERPHHPHRFRPAPS